MKSEPRDRQPAGRPTGGTSSRPGRRDPWLAVQLVAALALLAAFLGVALSALLLVGADSWSRSEPEAPFTAPVTLRGDAVLYFHPLAGFLIRFSLPALFASVAALLVLRGIDHWRRQASGRS